MAAAEKEETVCASATAAVGDGKVAVPPLMELYDELWFFRNALKRVHDGPASRAALPPSPPAKAEEEVVIATAAAKESSGKEGRPRAPRSRLLRAPSMPAYRTRPAEETSGGNKLTCGADGGGGVISRPCLATAGSLPAAYCGGEEGATAAQREGGGDRPRAARSSRLLRSSSTGWPTANARASSTSRLRPKYFASQTHLFVEANYRTYSADGRRWRSQSDLESFEVQGLKDLGFVFDAGGASHLASFIPGLREKRPSGGDDDGDIDDAVDRRPRPYLSEAWFVKRSAAAPKLEWPPAERRSAADMREQLRFWARAVACNVRQEC